jgi:hypothetical protein
MQNEYYEGLKMLMAASHRQMIVDDVPDGGMLFEWGCGGSSAWIADALAKKGAVIRSVEHHPEWYQKVVALEAKRANWTLEHIAPAAGYAFPNATKEEEDPVLLRDYVKSGAAAAYTSDVVLIDGVARGACLTMMAYLNPSPVIYLHDTHRDWYEETIRRVAEWGWTATRHEPGADEYPACITRLTRAQA